MEGIKHRLDASLETEKEKNDFLVGVPAIVDSIRFGKINCRVYRKEKFHAKTYITHARQAVVGSFALVGSSNFSYPGLSENVELNVQIVGQQVTTLQEWYEKHWDEAEDVTPEILRTIERHTLERSPFVIYAKSLQEFFRSHEMTVGEWELAGPGNGGSRMYPTLDKYQRDGYQSLMKIANQHGGAFLCDGVGLGKTFIGMMLLERLVEKDRQRVALFVPKAARGPVWEAKLRQYLPQIGGDFSNLAIFNHTDLMRGGSFQERIDRVAERADVIMIDEAHHFRNPGVKGEEGDRKTRYWRLFDIAAGQEDVSPYRDACEQSVDRPSAYDRAFHAANDPIISKKRRWASTLFQGHFRRMENELERLVYKVEGSRSTVSRETNEVEAEKVLENDALFHALVVQRSRAYVKQSQQQHGGIQALSPEREPPRVAEYSIKKTYGRLLEMVEKAFSKEKPLFSLAVYYPLAYYRKPKEETEEFAFKENRQKQVVRLIRIQFLKRFESSARAFEMSCETLLLKLLAWVTKHSQTGTEAKRLDRWKRQHAELIERVQQHQQEFSGDEAEEFDEDIITEEMLEDIDELPRKDYKVDEILAETYLDLDQIAEFLNELKKFKPSHDDKLNALIKLLKSDPVLKKHKALIFSEFMATARYLKKQLNDAGLSGVDEVDSADKRDRGEVIRRLRHTTMTLQWPPRPKGKDEIRVLISTDVLSEGLNLQDATRLINYDLHWNPVRLMQRIGRVDRRLDPISEKEMLADHPDQRKIRGKVVYWNFLPPGELDDLLRLYRHVSHKVLRISKTFGIEGKKLLKPDDDYEALKEFNEAYEGIPSATEKMRLEWQKLLEEHRGLEERLNALPGRAFSGKEHPTPNAKAVFFCYALPAPGVEAHEGLVADPNIWSEAMGHTVWYLYDVATEKITDEPTEIIKFIRAKPETPRRHVLPDKTLSEIRIKIERTYYEHLLSQSSGPCGCKSNAQSVDGTQLTWLWMLPFKA